MTILFDSHALIWFLGDNPRLSRNARNALLDPAAVLTVSAVSAWEFANKVRLGKWPAIAHFAERFVEIIEGLGYRILPISAEHAQLAGLMPGIHRDPFDRMLAAQSQIEGMPLVSADPAFKTLGTKVIW
ncbi:MAG TPA: type II toxin-antitoxin system VapC family toxin [Rhizomicrobium sp.]|nr:type II toxin-antitoxin system VapC family toxin [Rhizomicrobium sp.]